MRAKVCSTDDPAYPLLYVYYCDCGKLQKLYTNKKYTKFPQCFDCANPMSDEFVDSLKEPLSFKGHVRRPKNRDVPTYGDMF